MYLTTHYHLNHNYYHASKILQLKDLDISSAFEIVKDIVSALKQ